MSLKGQKKKSKSKGIEVNIIYIFTITFFIFIFVAMISFMVYNLSLTKYKQTNSTQYNTLKFLLTIILIAAIITFWISGVVIKEQCFNENKRFNSDSLRIWLYYIVPSLQLIIPLIIGSLSKKIIQNFLKSYTSISAKTMVLLSICFWIFYLFRCRKAIIETGSDRYLFYSKAGKSMLTAILIFSSATLFIDTFTSSTISKITISFPEKFNIVISSLFPEKQNIFKLVYQAINILVNSIYPFFDMYVYVRSKIDEFDKHEQEKREEQEKQKREELEQEKHEKEKREQLIKEKRELLKGKQREEL